MSKKPLVPDAQSELEKMKMEVANELGLHPNVNMADNYMGNITTKEAGLMAGFKNVGNVGGEMVKRMITQAERELVEREKNKK